MEHACQCMTGNSVWDPHTDPINVSIYVTCSKDPLKTYPFLTLTACYRHFKNFKMNFSILHIFVFQYAYIHLFRGSEKKSHVDIKEKATNTHHYLRQIKHQKMVYTVAKLFKSSLKQLVKKLAPHAAQSQVTKKCLGLLYSFLNPWRLNKNHYV